MIETLKYQNTLLNTIADEYEGVRKHLRLATIYAGRYLPRDLIYFPLQDAVVGGTYEENGMDMILVDHESCTWFDPMKAIPMVRLTGSAYVISKEILAGQESVLPILARHALSMESRALDFVAGMFVRTLAQRTARYLLSFNRPRLTVTQQIIADGLACRRESITECIFLFEGRGWISRSRGCINILNADALMDFSNTALGIISRISPRRSHVNTAQAQSENG